MGQVTITLNKRSYKIDCEDGQEEHLRALADIVDGHIGDLVAAVGQVGDLRLLVMCTLLLADELTEAQENAATTAGSAGGAGPDPRLDGAAASIERLAARIEAVAGRLEQS